MKLIRHGDPHEEKPGILLEDGRKLDVSPFVEDYDEEFFATAGISRLKQWLNEQVPDLSESSQGLPEIVDSVRIGPPVCRPGKIVCIGLNFRDHARETGMEIPAEPVIFMKAPSALSGPCDDLLLPQNSVKTDWEVELALVIARKATNVSEQEAMEYISGFVLFNDYSEREYQFNRGGQWVKGKSADTFAPLGPFVATADEIRDCMNLNMWLRVNGITKQKSNTSNMIFSVPKIISLISQYMTLVPGDIVSTGTPAGVGHGRRPREYLRKGDVVEYGIDGLGSARQTVISREDG